MISLLRVLFFLGFVVDLHFLDELLDLVVLRFHPLLENAEAVLVIGFGVDAA